MKLILKHADETRLLDLGTMPSKDAIACEDLTGLEWREWVGEVAQNRARALLFAWWLAGRRAGVEGERYSDLDLDLALFSLDVELDEQDEAGDETPEEIEASGPTGPGPVETPAG